MNRGFVARTGSQGAGYRWSHCAHPSRSLPFKPGLLRDADIAVQLVDEATVRQQPTRGEDVAGRARKASRPLHYPTDSGKGSSSHIEHRYVADRDGPVVRRIGRHTWNHLSALRVVRNGIEAYRAKK